MREAVFTVSPHTSYENLWKPASPALTSPTARPSRKPRPRSGGASAPPVNYEGASRVQRLLASVASFPLRFPSAPGNEARLLFSVEVQAPRGGWGAASGAGARGRGRGGTHGVIAALRARLAAYRRATRVPSLLWPAPTSRNPRESMIMPQHIEPMLSGTTTS